MRINNYLIVVIFLFILVPTANAMSVDPGVIFTTGTSYSGYCYQENAVSAVAGDGTCGLNYTGVYSTNSNWSDNSWSSSISVVTTTNYVNYTKPSGSPVSALWRYKDNNGEINISIPSECYDLSNTTLQLRGRLDEDIDDTFGDCYNGTAWVNLITTLSNNVFYEEGIYWYLSPNGTVNYNINTTDSVDGIYLNATDFGVGSFNLNNNVEYRKISLSSNNSILYATLSEYKSAGYYYNTSDNSFRKAVKYVFNSALNLDRYHSVQATKNMMTNSSWIFNGYSYGQNSTYNIDTTSASLIAIEHNKTINYSLYNNVTAANLVNFTLNVTYPYGFSYIAQANGTVLPIYCTEGDTLTIASKSMNGIADFTQSLPCTSSVNQTTATMNTVKVNVFDEFNGSSITGNVSVELVGSSALYNFTVTGGTKYLTNLTVDSYTVTAKASGYNDRQYIITVSDHSYQDLNIYLNSYNNTVIISVQDGSTFKLIPDVAVAIESSVSGNWTLVSSVYSDVNGKITFYYDPVAPYKFTFSKTGYATKNVTLNPIIFSTYTVKLTPSTVAPPIFLEGVNINNLPTVCYNDAVNNFTFLINSPNGTLQGYGYNSYASNNPGINSSGSGVNAYGESFTYSLNLTGMTLVDYVSINYYYQDINSQTNFTATHTCKIQNPTPYNYTLAGSGANDWGLSLFDKILIILITSLIVAGLAFFYGGIEAAAIMSIFVFGLFTLTGFIPVWITVIAVLLLVIYMGANNR